MSTAHHTPYAVGGPLTSVAMNAPLGQLDAAITAMAGGGGGGVTVRASGGDDLTALRAAVTSLPNGGVINLPDPLYLLSAQWAIDTSGIFLVGAGSSGVYYGVPPWGTWIRRTGTADLGAKTAAVVFGDAAFIINGGARGVSFDAAGLADFALHIQQANGLTFEDISAWQAAVAQIEMNSYTASPIVNCVIKKVFTYGVDGSNGIRADGGTYSCQFYDVICNHSALGDGYTARSFLNASINASATTITLTAGGIVGWPVTNGFVAVLDSRQDGADMEWVLVTAGAGTTTWTVTRGYNNTLARAHTAGAAHTKVWQPYSGAAMMLLGGDDITVYGYGFAGTGIGIELGAGSAGHSFYGGYPGTRPQIPVVARATGLSYPDYPARGHTFYGMSVVDSHVRPIIEPGAQVRFIDGDGLSTMATDIRTSMVPIEQDFIDSQTITLGSFVTSRIVGGWDITGYGASNAAGYLFAQGHPGVLRMTTAATASNEVTLALASGVGVIDGIDAFECEWIVRPLSMGVSDATYRIGLGKNVNQGAPTDGVYFEKLPGDAFFQAVVRVGGAQTRTPLNGTTSVALQTNTWNRLRIRRHSKAYLSFLVGDPAAPGEGPSNLIQMTTWADPASGSAAAQIADASLSGLLSPFVQIKTAGAAVSIDVDANQIRVIGLYR